MGLSASPNRWVIAAFHYSTNVFKNPIVDGYRKAIYQVGIAAAVVALIVGIFVGRMLARRN